jgi:hypothetical protein
MRRKRETRKRRKQKKRKAACEKKLALRALRERYEAATKPQRNRNESTALRLAGAHEVA